MGYGGSVPTHMRILLANVAELQQSIMRHAMAAESDPVSEGAHILVFSSSDIATGLCSAERKFTLSTVMLCETDAIPP